MGCLGYLVIFVFGTIAVLFYLLFSWLGLTSIALGGAIIFLIPVFICLICAENRSSKEKKQKERRQEERRREETRRNTPCYFNDGISEDDFREMAYRISNRISRLTVYQNGAQIRGEVESQSGISTWEFLVDFNDYGHITGSWWMLERENDDSNIPNRFADLMSEAICDRLSQ